MIPITLKLIDLFKITIVTYIHLCPFSVAYMCECCHCLGNHIVELSWCSFPLVYTGHYLAADLLVLWLLGFLSILFHALPWVLDLGSMGDAHSTGCCSLHFEQLQIPEDLVFIVFKGAIQTSKRSERSIVLASYDTYKPQQWPAWQDTRSSAIVALTFWQQPTVV